MVLLFTLLAFNIGIEQHLFNQIDAILKNTYPEGEYKYELTLRWIPSSIQDLDASEIDIVEHIGEGLPKGNAVFKIQYHWNSRPVNATIQAKVDLWQYVPVFTQRVKPGDKLDTDLIVKKWVNITRSFEDYVTDIEDLTNTVAKGYIKAGVPIRKNEIKSNPVVLPGSSAVMELQQGNLRIEIPVEARQEAAVGEQVRVYSSSTNKMYLATAVGPERVKWIKTQ